MRLLQTARLLELMLDHSETDLDPVRSALAAVREARGLIRGLDVQPVNA